MRLASDKRTFYKRTAQSQVGEVAEQIRALLNSKYDAVPPNLSSEFQADNSVVITGANPESGLNVRITVQDIATVQQQPLQPAGGTEVPPQQATPPATPPANPPV